MTRRTICLWYDGTALDALDLHNIDLTAPHHAPEDCPNGRQVTMLTVEIPRSWAFPAPRPRNGVGTKT